MCVAVYVPIMCTFRQSEEELNGARFWGELAVYPGSGYVQLLPSTYNVSQDGSVNFGRSEARALVQRLEVAVCFVPLRVCVFFLHDINDAYRPSTGSMPAHEPFSSKPCC